MRRTDERPEVEVLDPGREHREERIEVGPRRSTRRTQVLVLTAVAALIAGGLVLGDGDDATTAYDAEEAGDDPGAAEQSVERQVARATSGSAVTATTSLGDGRTPVFGEPVGASVLLGSEQDGGSWRLLDLDTGTLRAIAALDGVPLEAMVPVRRGVVLLDRPAGGGPTLVELPSGGRSPLRIRFDDPAPRLSAASGLLPSGRPDRLWVTLTPAGGPPHPDATPQAVLVGLDGEVHLQLDLRRTPTLGTASGLVFSAGGRTYVQDRDGTRPLGDGTAHAASATEVSVLACDDLAVCRTDVIDVASGERRVTVPLADVDETALWMALSADGDVATLPASSAALRAGDAATGPALLLRVLERDGQLLSTRTPSIRSTPVWLPGSLGVLAITGYGLVRYVDEGNGLVSRRLPGLRTTGDDALLLIPHA